MNLDFAASQALGFSVLLLALVCELGRRRERSLPWGWLSLGLLALGLGELLRGYGGASSLERGTLVLRQAFLLAGYGLALEFARRALPLPRLRALPFVLHLLLPVSLILGAVAQPGVLAAGLWSVRGLAALGIAAACIGALRRAPAARRPWLLALGLVALPALLLVFGDFPQRGLVDTPSAERMPAPLAPFLIGAALLLLPISIGLHMSGMGRAGLGRGRRASLIALGGTLVTLTLLVGVELLVPPAPPAAFLLTALGCFILLALGGAERAFAGQRSLWLAARVLRARWREREAVLAALPAAVFWSRDGRGLAGGNPACAQALGLDAGESLAGRHPVESGLMAASAEAFAARNAAALAAGEAQHGVEEHLEHKDGVTHVLLADRVPLPGGRGLVGLLTDPSGLREALQRERTAREAAEANMRARAESLSSLSNEVRTPMNAIMGMTELALQTRLDAEQREYLEAVQLSTEHLLGVLGKIFELAMLETGRVDLEPVDFRLDDLLRNLESTFRPQAEAKGLSFGIALESELPQQFHGDLQRLQRILGNMLGNAVKFTEAGSVSLRVGELAKDREWIRMRFEVADSGVGIPPDKLEAIFSPFTRSSTSCAKEGSGLGLCMSRDLASRLGGRIHVTSQPGRGSRFSLELPLQYTAGAAPARRVAMTVPGEPRPSSRGLRVLLVEDNAVNQRLAIRLLEKAGYSAQEAWNGEEALTLLRRPGELPFDLLIMDLQMPILDGFAATRLIREEERERGGHLPIIAMTAHAMAGARERCLAAGMDGYVAKPVRQETLLAEIDAVLRRLAEGVPGADSPLDAGAAQGDKEPAGTREY